MTNETSLPALQRYRTLGKTWERIFAAMTVAGVLFAIHEIFRIGWVSYHEHVYYYGVVAIFLSVSFLVFPLSSRAPRDRIPWYDVLLFLLTIATSAYLMTNAFRISGEGWAMAPPPAALVVSIVVWGLVLEALRRGGGLVLTVFTAAVSLYPLVAASMPGFLEGAGWSFPAAAAFHVLTRESIIGIPTRTFCELVIGFMVFSSTLQVTGGGTYFTRFASALLGGVRGGPAKVSVVASGLFGSISGSAVANVAADGWITIPTMKKTGYSAEYASAVEACASAGGSIMPPVMGAVAFVMASFLEVSYGAVAMAAAVPAFLYYLGLFVQIDAHAAKQGLAGLPRAELPSLVATIKEGWIYLGSIVALVYLLFELKQEAQAPFVASALLLAGAALRRETRPSAATFYRLVVDAGKVLVEMIAILAGIGLIMGGLSMTGVAISFSSELVNLFGKNAFAMLFLGAIVSYILGMGMTITACYIILAVVLVPALTPLGFDVMAVHLFVLYCGLFSFITPPVALAAYVAAVIGGANFWQTSFQAMRLGFVKYLVPFFFVYNPALILHGDSVLAIVETVAAACLGVFILGSSIEGYLAGLGRLTPVPRTLLLAIGFLFFYPDLRADLIALPALLAVVVAMKMRRRAREALTARPSPG
ncbi:MAG: TRAP transporter fused permease subunit [Candidatus Rokubacteria bacterium]|nr:TRAP transporter fused permease subunit [Candidatus Rokubacteria bacterium]